MSWDQVRLIDSRNGSDALRNIASIILKSIVDRDVDTSSPFYTTASSSFAQIGEEWLKRIHMEHVEL